MLLLLLLGGTAVGEEVALWRTCHGPAGAYAAAWFARRDTVLETEFGDKLGMEFHDYFMFHQGGNGRPRVPLKSADAGAFWVNHLSEYEHTIERAKVADAKALLVAQTERAERRCVERPAVTEAAVVAVVPFWGGAPETDSAGKVVGNSHSRLERSLKTRQLRAVACSIRAALGARVVVGVANDADQASVEAIREEVWQVRVKHGAHLAFAVLRELQRRVETEALACDFVYFTEADQILYSELSARQLMGAVGQHVYVAPNRLREPFPRRGNGLVRLDDVPHEFSQNICNGELVATLARPPGTLPARTFPERGTRVSWPALDTPRAVVVDREINAALASVRARNRYFKDDATSRQNARHTYASALSPGYQPLSSKNHTVVGFARCWNQAEKQVGAWFAHAKLFLAADVQRLKAPLKSLSALTAALDELKLSRSWHTWTLSTTRPTDFATCRLCRGRWPPYDASGQQHQHHRAGWHHHHHHRHAADAPHRRRRHYPTERRRRLDDHHHNATDPCVDYAAAAAAVTFDRPPASRAEAVALVPLVARVPDQAAFASLCSALHTFDAVVVGVCENDLGHRALASRLDYKLSGRVNFTTLDCNVPRGVGTHDTTAALPLARYAWESLKARHWHALFLFFAPLGDLVYVRDLDALKSAVSTSTYVVAHRFHDTKDGLDTTHAKPLECGNATRDWLFPLGSARRGSRVAADATTYLLIPR